MRLSRLRMLSLCMIGIVGVICLTTFAATSRPASATNRARATSATNCVSATASYQDMVSQFHYDASAPLQVQEISVVNKNGVAIHDITYVSEGKTISAYLVEPGGNGPFAAIEFIHWLASTPDANRTEFLQEAITLAHKGAVSLLPQGTYPWIDSPVNAQQDCANTIQQTIALRRGLDLLLSIKTVDSKRVAFVGHDYGAMYGAILAGVETRIKTFVLMTPIERFSAWNVPFFLPALNPADRLKYINDTAAIDPINYIGHAAPASLLFQFAKNDVFVAEGDVLNLTELASKPNTVKLYDTGHHLNDAARLDRLSWLIQHLHLT